MRDIPLVSIVAVCYNHSQYIIETLDSIKNQTYRNIELIIMDDCSTDNSVEVIQQWINENNYSCKFIAHDINKGLCKTLNDALGIISGKYYQVLACDDIILKNKIENQVSLFRKLNEDYAVIYSDANIMDKDSKKLHGLFIQRHKPKMLKVPSGYIYDELMQSNYIPAMSVLIRTDYVRKIKGYDEDISYEDYDLWLRLAKSYKFHFSDYKCCMYRIHNNNMHASDEFKNKALINSFYIFSKHLDNTLAYNKAKLLIMKMYQNGLYKKHKEVILSKDIDGNILYFIKKDISYKNYRRYLKLRKMLKKLV